MVKKVFIISLVLLLPTLLFASTGGQMSLLGGYTTANQKPFWNMSVNPYISYSENAMKAEIRGDITSTTINGINVLSLSLKRADFRFRLPSFGGKKMTITAGLSPISWGLGTYYRIGDVLLEDFSQNEQAGVNDSRNIWLISISQSLGNNFSFDVAVTLPLSAKVYITQNKTIMEQSQKLATGLKVKKSFKDETLKALNLYASINEDKDVRLATAFDLSLYFDITTGIETRFRSNKDLLFAINMMKLYSIETEMNSYQLGLYLASQLDFYKEKYSLCSAITFTPTERLSIYLSLTTTFSNSGFEELLVTPSLSFILTDAVKLEVSGGYKSKENIFFATTGFKAVF